MDIEIAQHVDTGTYPLILRALRDDIFSFQKAAISSNFLLKPGLYVKEDIVFIALAFHIGPNLRQLGF